MVIATGPRSTNVPHRMVTQRAGVSLKLLGKFIGPSTQDFVVAPPTLAIKLYLKKHFFTFLTSSLNPPADSTSY